MIPSAASTPLVTALRERGAAIRAAEIERARRRLGQLEPEQEQALQALGCAIVDQLLRAPTAALDEMARRGEVAANDRLVRSVLGLA